MTFTTPGSTTTDATTATPHEDKRGVSGAGPAEPGPFREAASKIVDSAGDLRDRAVEGGLQIGVHAKSGSAKVYRAVRARPRLTIGLVALGGIALTAFLLRKRIPGAVEKLSAAAAGVAIAAGAPEAIDAIRGAGRDVGRKVGSNRYVRGSLALLEDAPDQLSELGGRLVRLKPVKKVREQLRGFG